MTNAWNAAVAECSPELRRERGFWIHLNTSSDEYEQGPLVIGPNVAGLGAGHLNLGMPIFCEPKAIPDPDASGALYSVGWFHTHTSLQFVTNRYPNGRTVGPSQSDLRWSGEYQHPGIAFDYEAVPFGGHTNRIPRGHPKHSPAKPYPAVPPERRPIR